MTVNKLIQSKANIDNPNINDKQINYLTTAIEHWNGNQC